MRVWILQTGEPIHTDKGGLRPMRAMNLSKALIDGGHEVTLWTSRFDHFTKSQRSINGDSLNYSEKLQIRYIKSRGYKSHLSLGRLIDHAELGWNLKKMLRLELPPDVAFVGYPPIEPAWVMSRWLKKAKKPFVLDIKDAWPEVLIQAFPGPLRPLARLMFLPYKLMMKNSLKNADGINTITNAFLLWSLKQAKREQHSNDNVTPLTSPELNFSESEIKDAKEFWDSIGVLDNNELRVYFVGTLNNVFDFSNTFVAAKNLGIQFVIAGDGPQRSEMVEKSVDLKNLVLPGWISSVQAKILAERSTFAIAPIKSRTDFEISIPNKFIDAFMYGKPMLTSLDGTSSKLLLESRSGVTFDLQDENDLTKVLEKLISNRDLISQMSKSSRQLYLQDFEFNRVYGDLVKHLEILSRGSSHNA
jgi:glycosyltransferase involved in cell wall biosynthesis